MDVTFNAVIMMFSGSEVVVCRDLMHLPRGMSCPNVLFCWGLRHH